MICQPPWGGGYKLLFSREGRETLKAFVKMDAPLHHKAAIAIAAAVSSAAISSKIIN